LKFYAAFLGPKKYKNEFVTSHILTTPFSFFAPFYPTYLME